MSKPDIQKTDKKFSIKHHSSFRRTLIILLVASYCYPVQADWRDMLKAFTKKEPEKTSVENLSELANRDIVAGLKEALSKGTDYAVQLLGKKDGFLDNASVRIPMPESLQTVEKSLRSLGQDKIADNFIETMNHAAEQAVPSAADIFANSIKNMTFSDAKEILRGADDAATQYLRKSNGQQLHDAFLPIVKQATDNVQLTSSYKTLIDKLGSLSNFIDTDKLDLEEYVTGKALDGLFLMIAEEEIKIRKNPVARTTDLLKKVFAGSP